MEFTVEKIIEKRAAQIEAGCYYNPEADFLLKQVKSQKETLEKLARLGNGEHYGNSDGNCIAIDELKKYPS